MGVGGRDGGETIYKRQNQREQLEAEARKKTRPGRSRIDRLPREGASLWSEAIWLTAKHRPGQDKPGREPTEAQATRDTIGYPPVHQQSPIWAQPHANLHSKQVATLVSLLLLLVLVFRAVMGRTQAPRHVRASTLPPSYYNPQHIFTFHAGMGKRRKGGQGPTERS